MREPRRLGRLGKGWTLSDDDVEGDDGWDVLQKVPIRIRSAKHSAPLLGRSKTLYVHTNLSEGGWLQAKLRP
jgi:hypothetical protein